MTKPFARLTAAIAGMLMWLTCLYACAATGASPDVSQNCQQLAKQRALDESCAVEYAKAILVQNHVPLSMYKRFEARFLAERRVWVVTARYEPKTPDADKDLIVSLDGTVQYVP
jgi:hypothetical protein